VDTDDTGRLTKHGETKKSSAAASSDQTTRAFRPWPIRRLPPSAVQPSAACPGFDQGGNGDIATKFAKAPLAVEKAGLTWSICTVEPDIFFILCFTETTAGDE